MMAAGYWSSLLTYKNLINKFGNLKGQCSIIHTH